MPAKQPEASKTLSNGAGRERWSVSLAGRAVWLAVILVAAINHFWWSVSSLLSAIIALSSLPTAAMNAAKAVSAPATATIMHVVSFIMLSRLERERDGG